MQHYNNHIGAIGVFDSGYGGLTVLKSLTDMLPQYDYVYLGDNARSPYGTRSYNTVYEYTLQCVAQLFAMGCPLVILACNTASAKALRTIQQQDLQHIATSQHRVLGVIRPTTEVIGNYTKTNHVGILGTNGTITSHSYPIEISHTFPKLVVHQQACPMWVPLIENNAHNTEGGKYFIKQEILALLNLHKEIDTILLACTHYPIIVPIIQQYLPPHITLISQGTIVANSLKDYLSRHTTMQQNLTSNGTQHYYTTDDAKLFNEKSGLFLGKNIVSTKIEIE